MKKLITEIIGEATKPYGLHRKGGRHWAPGKAIRKKPNGPLFTVYEAYAQSKWGRWEKTGHKYLKKVRSHPSIRPVKQNRLTHI